VPAALAAEIEATARRLGRSKSTVVRERLRVVRTPAAASASAIADLIGSVDGLSADLSGRTKAYLRFTGSGRKRAR
jgi:hypothetical protein